MLIWRWAGWTLRIRDISIRLKITIGENMPVPPRKSGDNEYRVSYEKPPAGIATETLFAKDEATAKKVFRTYVGKYDIRGIRKLS